MGKSKQLERVVKTGDDVTVFLGPKWETDEAVGVITDVVGEWDGHTIVNVSFDLPHEVPAFDDAGEPLEEPMIEYRPTEIFEVFLFNTARSARSWLADGHQSIGVVLI